MSMAAENLQVVGEVLCITTYLGLVQPEKPLPNTKFLMDFKVKMKRHVWSSDLVDFQEVTEERNRCKVELEYNPNDMWIATSKHLQDLRVPAQVRRALEDPVIEATREARADCFYHTRKYMHMEVEIHFQIDDGAEDSLGISDYKPMFVSASDKSIEKLERTRVEESSIACSVCMDDFEVGSEATCLPCSHLYHDDCIVEWLHTSGVCPLCKFRLP